MLSETEFSSMYWYFWCVGVLVNVFLSFNPFGVFDNAKISAVRSLADICFLHVLIRLIRCIIVSVCSSVFKWC